MIVVLLANVSRDWAQQIRSHMQQQAVILEDSGPQATPDLLQSVPADLVITQMLSLTAAGIAAYEQMLAHAREAVLLCIAPQEVIEKVRADELPAPDLWLRPSDNVSDWKETIAHATEKAALRAERAMLHAGPPEGAPRGADAQQPPSAPAMDVFHRLMGGFAGGFDLDRLLSAYVDAVTQFVQCATFCLLWQEAASGCYLAYAQRGLRAEIVEDAKLLPTDALPAWYRRNRRVVTATELADWPDRSTAVGVKHELDLFCGQVAMPFMVRGRLAGILILGEKVLGDSYSTAELETLFAMSNYVGLAVESIELHQELRRSKAYTDRIVHTMSAGLITLGPDQRISLCNPYAAQVLGLDRREVEGADLRCLPSPLGDYLYAALKSPDNAVAAEEVTIRGGELSLRVSTSALLDDDGEVLGSVMLLDDITTEIELTQERSRAERLDVLACITGRIAHEVKNPLTAIRTYTELIGDRGPDQDLAQFWSRTVRPEIDHLDELVSNLVRMADQPKHNLKPARIEDLISEVVSQLRSGQDDEQGLFDIEIAEDLPSVTVDPKPTQDALKYLLRYMAGPEPSSVSIHVAQRPEDEASITVTMRRLSHQDGSFDPDTIFDPLYAIEHFQADLGPVIGHRIIASQYGGVEAACENGHMTMRVVLPISPAGRPTQGPEVT